MLATATACSSDIAPEMITPERGDNMGEIPCTLESQDQGLTRTYYETDGKSNFYYAKWGENDQLAVCCDGETDARRFAIRSGQNSANAIFYGTVPDQFSDMMAVYPFSAFKKRNAETVEMELPATIHHDSERMLDGTMPMFARGKAGVLNFYNLMGVMKLSLHGSGLLKSISVISPDGHGLSGHARIIAGESNIPKLLTDDNKSQLNVELGNLFLGSDTTVIMLPVPALTYENGIRLDFIFEGKTETRILNGPLHFERSVMRGVKPFGMNVAFDFDNYKTRDNEIWYKSNVPQEISKNGALDVSIIGHSYSPTLSLGVITAGTHVGKIEKKIFPSPQEVTFLKLPNTIREIAAYGFEGTAIESFVAPSELRILKDGVFMGSHKMKKLVLNDGFEVIGGDCFADCPNLESVFLPSSLRLIESYAFRESTRKLDHWDGDCRLIDPDMHTLYGNTFHGTVVENETMIDAIAGCNLIEYAIPEQALFTQHYAFFGCPKVRKLTIHKKFRSFGLNVFKNLTSLETIICHAETPPAFDSDEVYEAKNLKEIRVPKDCVSAYKEAPGWKNFSDKIKAL